MGKLTSVAKSVAGFATVRSLFSMFEGKSCMAPGWLSGLFGS
jgi:hypothetical protein